MDEKKIYLIYEHSGSYEDYMKYLIKAFFDKNKAINYKNKKEKEIEKDKMQYEKYCSKCSGFGIIPNGCCNYETYKEHTEYNECINKIGWYDIDNLYYTLEEIEVE